MERRLVGLVLLGLPVGALACGGGDGARDVADHGDVADGDSPEGPDTTDVDGEGDSDHAADLADDTVPVVCGDGVVNGGEACDDGNRVSGDGCESDCSFSCRDPSDCDDRDGCTVDACEPVSGGRACIHAIAAGAPCNDGDSCTAIDVCGADGSCAGTLLPPGTPAPLAPANGAPTGGVVLPSWQSPLRPTFRWSSIAAGTCVGDYFEVQVDDSCDAGGFAACDFPSPEASTTSAVGDSWTPPADLPVSTTPPVGRRYYWRVRACRDTICSPWSLVHRVEVGRAAMDFDGDGYSDLAVGAFGGILQEGLVFVYRGSSSGLAGTPACTLSVPGNPAGTGFGMAIAWAGDLNGDGYGDLAVGAPFVDESGAVHVYFGSTAGIPAASSLVLRAPATPARALFGRSLASGGDGNGDGYDDLVVGAPGFDGTTVSEGAAYVFHGGAAGPAAAPTVTLRHPVRERSAWFGSSVGGGGDVDGDGYADVLVGAPFADTGGTDSGGAWLFRGGAAGISTIPTATFTDPVPEPGSLFGAACAVVGDLDGDTLADLAVGAPMHDGAVVNEGRAYVWYGSRGTLPAAPPVVLADPVPGVEARFGAAIGSAGDINRNGTSELLVGADLKDAGSPAEGNAWVYYGGPGGISTSPTATFDNPAGEVNGMFGVATVGAGDVNGDGYADVAIGAFQQDGNVADEGATFVYLGCSCGHISTVPVQTLDHPLDRFDGRFGFAISPGAGR
ncbi:MAG: FG-GAP-like repeat-containing protein [Myxococcota bacterium]|nr:FG-GAP-like repeat-containing protein [Myxococcota bacterium]